MAMKTTVKNKKILESIDNMLELFEKDSGGGLMIKWFDEKEILKRANNLKKSKQVLEKLNQTK